MDSDEDTTTIEYEIEVVEDSSSSANSLSQASNNLVIQTSPEQAQYYVIQQIEDEEASESEKLDLLEDCKLLQQQQQQVQQEEPLHLAHDCLAPPLLPSPDNLSKAVAAVLEQIVAVPAQALVEIEPEELGKKPSLVEQKIPCTQPTTTKLDQPPPPPPTTNDDKLLLPTSCVATNKSNDLIEPAAEGMTQQVRQEAPRHPDDPISNCLPQEASSQQEEEEEADLEIIQLVAKTTLIQLSEKKSSNGESIEDFIRSPDPILIRDSYRWPAKQQVEDHLPELQPLPRPAEAIIYATIDNKLVERPETRLSTVRSPIDFGKSPSPIPDLVWPLLEDYGTIGEQISVCVYDTGQINQWPTLGNSLETSSLEEGDDGDLLERELDEEPEFERRQVQVKQGRDVRSDYGLSNELGRGKFGTVYRCRELATGKEFAAKFVHMRRREDREDVMREIEIMTLLQHKRLLQLFDAYDDLRTNEMCLITELVEGGELFERIIDDDFQLTERKAAIFMRQICEGVDYMHSMGIVHLDMKPENILCVSKTGCRIKLIDFGLARQLKANEPLRVMFGTPDFAAPEVLAYDLVSLATDMWSVGVICYVLLSGLSPFMGENDIETMANVTRATYDFDDESFDPISDLAKDFISKLLVRDQASRMKPAQCLKHPWLQKGGQQLEIARRATARRQSEVPTSGAYLQEADRSYTLPLMVSLDKRNLKKYVVRRKWHKTVHAIMALGRMGAHLKQEQEQPHVIVSATMKQ